MRHSACHSRSKRLASGAALFVTIVALGVLQRPRTTAAATPLASARDDTQPAITTVPLRLQRAVELLAGVSVADVRVHHRSLIPGHLGADAIAAGDDIHLGPHGEKQLGHELWHVVQQRQGRVRARRKLGQVYLDDSPRLELEADVMGSLVLATSWAWPYAPGSAAMPAPVTSCTRCAPPVVQRKITFAGQEVEDLFNDPNSVDANAIKGQIATKLAVTAFANLDQAAVTDVLQAYRVQSGKTNDFTNRGELADFFATDYKFRTQGMDLPEEGQLTRFLRRQQGWVIHVAYVPSLYAGKLISVGFEHEFLQYEPQPTGPLPARLAACYFGIQDYDHLELHTTGQTRFYNALPFVLETDSGNEIELVTPPFLIPAAMRGVPFPSYDFIRAYENMMSAELRRINQTVKTSNPAYTLQQLVAELARLGVPFSTVLADADVDSTMLTHRTPSIVATVPASDLGNLCMRSAEKGGQLISHQVNFATDPLIYTAIKADTMETDSYRFDLLRIAMRIIKQTFRVASQRPPSIRLRAFLLELAAATSNQHAVPAMQAYLGYVERLFEGAEQPLAKSKDDKLSSQEDQSSFVKDWQGIWLKTSLYNFALGLLSSDEVGEVIDFSKKGGAYDAELRQAVTLVFFKEHKAQLKDELKGFTDVEYQEAVDAIVAFPRLVADRLARGDDPDERFVMKVSPYSDETRRRRIYEHMPSDLGPRQDTFIGWSKSAMPGLWPNRALFVVETRDEPHDNVEHPSLQAFDGKLKKLTSAQDVEAMCGTAIAELWNRLN